MKLEDALQSKINFIFVSNIKWQFNDHAYDEKLSGKNNNVNYHKYATRAAIIVPIVMVVIVFILAVFRTTTSTTGFSYASS